MSRSCRFALLAALTLATGFAIEGPLRGQEADPYADYCVEIQWQSDETFPVHRMKLVSEKQADAAKAWATPKTSRNPHDLPTLEELIEDASRFEYDGGAMSEFHANFYHIAVLSEAECAALHRRLEKMPRYDGKHHVGYDAVVDSNGDRDVRKLGSPAETCKFLREACAEMDAETATAIEAFVGPVERILGAARTR